MSRNIDDMKQIIDRLRALQEDDNDSMDNSQLARLMMLARDGLVPEEDIRLARQAILAMNNDQLPTFQQRTVLLGMLETLVDIVTSNPAAFSRIRSAVKTKDDE